MPATPLTLSQSIAQELADSPAGPPCRHCRSPRTIRTTFKPPRKHNGPCTPECTRPGIFCRDCRMMNESA